MKYCISNGKTMILVESEPDSEIFWKIAEWYGADAILLEQIPEGVHCIDWEIDWLLEHQAVSEI